MDAIKHWIEHTPYSVPILGVGLVVFFLILNVIISALKQIKSGVFYDLAKDLNLEIVQNPSKLSGGIPRIVGLVGERNVEISGYHKASREGIMLNYARIKMRHNAYLVRSITIEYNALKSPPLRKITIEHKEHPRASLLELEAFDEDILRNIEIFLNKYSKGESIYNTILSFGVDEITFDRDVKLVGDKTHLLNCIKDMDMFIKMMEEKTKRK